jgi:transcriptional regulator with XRE-family HTH domain
MSTYGEYFKALREAKGLTLREVEKLTEISNAYLSQLESGKIKQPSPNILSKLAGFYDVSYNNLMEKVGYPKLNSETNLASADTSVRARIGQMSQDEEIELLKYLKFIRNRKK